MEIDRRLLAIIGRRLPAIYDVIPRGPQRHFWQSRFSEVALNPQPLPPHPPEELGAAVAAEVIQLAWLADRMGNSRGLAFTDLDDWCPTVPKKPKLPPWWQKWSRAVGQFFGILKWLPCGLSRHS